MRKLDRRIESLDLNEFVRELEKQGAGDKSITLRNIISELQVCKVGGYHFIHCCLIDINQFFSFFLKGLVL